MSARGGEIYKSLTAALEEVAGVWEGLKVRLTAKAPTREATTSSTAAAGATALTSITTH